MKIVNILVLALWASAGSAATVTPYSDEASFLSAAGGTTTETFNGVSNNANLKNQTVTVGDVSLSIVGGDGRINTSGSSTNNVDGTTFVQVQRLGASSHLLRITFPETKAFAADFQSLNAGRTDTNVFVLGQQIVPTQVGSGQGSFFGIVSDMAFTSIEFRRGSRDSIFGLDNVQLALAPVPVPASVLLLLAGIGALGAVRARRRP
jgi:hypothetical protein